MKKTVKAPILSALFMGLGQIYNKEYFKGILYALVEIISLIFFLPYIGTSVYGLITLGETPMYFVDGIAHGDHSIFLLVDGLIAVLVLVIILIIYVVNIIDAKNSAKRIEESNEPMNAKQFFKHVWDKYYAQFMLALPMLGVAFFVILPIIFTMSIAFTNYSSPNHLPPKNLVDWVGFKNFKDLFTLDIWNGTFIAVGKWTIIWALFATVTNYFVGLFMALLVNWEEVKLKRLWRSIFILPYAIPGFISLLIMRLAFSGPGPINNFLVSMGMNKVAWFTNPLLAKVMIIVINIWLGSPYWMALMSGVLTNIDKEMYEAADMDGASKTQKFTKITLPMVLYQTSALMIMTFAFNFNNFQAIYLLTDGNPVNGNYRYAGSTDILISWIYKLTKDQNQYNMASVITILLFLFIATISAYSFTKTKAFKEEDMM
ncbi:MAG: sugar ABC transporter permease [Epulopiscium sp.]|nr:sugar ABC transporter permease [Candidatus Epulonipiscium sp.]